VSLVISVSHGISLSGTATSTFASPTAVPLGGIEFVELPLDPLGAGTASLLLEQHQRLSPHQAGLVTLSECDVRVTYVVEGARSPIGVAECAVQGKRLVILVDGALMVACAVGNEPKTAPSGRLPVEVMVVSVQGECRATVFAGGIELAQTRGAQAHEVERVGLPHRPLERAVKVTGVSGMLQRPPAIPSSSPGERQHSVGMCLLGRILVAHGQIEGSVQVPGGLLVPPQPGTDIAEEPMGANAGDGVGQVGGGL
jgi:hypothetical protein